VHATQPLRKQNAVLKISTYLEFVISKLFCDVSVRLRRIRCVGVQ
jgi:hypothetical protein